MWVKFVSLLLLPPGGLLLTLLAALLLRRRWPHAALSLALAAGLALYALSLPDVARQFAAGLEADNPPLDIGQARASGAGAIVVLGAGTRLHAPEYGLPAPGYMALERLRYAAFLHRATGLPVVASGGGVYEGFPPEGAVMAQALREDFRVAVVLEENRSANTWENAAFTAALLKSLGMNDVRKVLVVTHAWHMPRTRLAFEAAGLEMVAAPTGWLSRRGDGRLPDLPLSLRFLPHAEPLRHSTLLLHEYLGLLWYRLRQTAAV
jgi:uncharacterized SAM-binding protein YcdF (DUF218 family)